MKWWHVLRGDEALLEKEWSKVKEQTSWSIEPCCAYEDNAQDPSSKPDKSPIVTNNTLGDDESHKESTEASELSDNGAENNPQQSFLEGK